MRMMGLDMWIEEGTMGGEVVDYERSTMMIPCMI